MIKAPLASRTLGKGNKKGHAAGGREAAEAPAGAPTTA